MRLLHHDDQRLRLRFAVCSKLIRLLLPRRADLPRQQIRHQQVIQVTLMPAERQHHMLARLQLLDDLLDAFPRIFLDDIRFREQQTQFAMQAFRRGDVHAMFVRPRGDAIRMRRLLRLTFLILNLDFIPIHRLKSRKPIFLERCIQSIQRGRRCILQIQRSR